MTRALPLAGLLGLLLLCTGGLGRPYNTLDQNLSTETPADFTDSTGVHYLWDALDSIYLAPKIPTLYILTGAGITSGLLGIYSNANLGDTTTATPYGFSWPESTVCLGWKWDFRYSGGAPSTDSVLVYRCTGTATTLVAKGGSAADFGRLKLATPVFAGPNDMWVFALKAGPGSSGAAKIMIRADLHPFQRYRG